MWDQSTRRPLLKVSPAVSIVSMAEICSRSIVAADSARGLGAHCDEAVSATICCVWAADAVKFDCEDADLEWFPEIEWLLEETRLLEKSSPLERSGGVDVGVDATLVEAGIKTGPVATVADNEGDGGGDKWAKSEAEVLFRVEAPEVGEMNLLPELRDSADADCKESESTWALRSLITTASSALQTKAG